MSSISRVNPLILFDIDGTLLKAGDRRHGAAFTHAFESVFGKPVTLDGVPLAGMLDAQIARVLFERHGLDVEESDVRLTEMMEMMGLRYVETLAGASLRERLLPGVTEAVLACLERDWAAGVLTGNARSVGHAKLQAAGLETLLGFGAFGDSAAERSHLVDAAISDAERVTGVRHSPAETVLVGDTPNDISAARLGSARVVAVATGRFDLAALEHHHPDALLPDLADTDAFVAAVEQALNAPVARPR
jgi:phosphoglycolate phosphatase-like HAD superfamily hydrolase